MPRGVQVSVASVFSVSSSMSQHDMEGEAVGVNSSTIRESARAQLRALVEKAERITGSRMAAYEMVAQQVGAGSVWVRHFANDYATAKLDTTVLNISEAYRRSGQVDGKI